MIRERTTATATTSSTTGYRLPEWISGGEQCGRGSDVHPILDDLLLSCLTMNLSQRLEPEGDGKFHLRYCELAEMKPECNTGELT